mmetsp:Transcript_6315/g.14415  ORF Transcript_6315/g.14415 Transcript_6315/m.14415 type:complete len:203 (+) Transcript_6315:1604-2212(+)
MSRTQKPKEAYATTSRTFNSSLTSNISRGIVMRSQRMKKLAKAAHASWILLWGRVTSGCKHEFSVNFASFTLTEVLCAAAVFPRHRLCCRSRGAVSTDLVHTGRICSMYLSRGMESTESWSSESFSKVSRLLCASMMVKYPHLPTTPASLRKESAIEPSKSMSEPIESFRVPAIASSSDMRRSTAAPSLAESSGRSAACPSA